MKKALAILLTAVMLLGVLTACGSKKDDAADDTQNAEDADKAAADNVAALIDAIYVQERTDETDAQCAAAKAAWDALTNEQKSMVEGEEATPITSALTRAMRPRTIPGTRTASARTSCWSFPSARPTTTAASTISRASRTPCRRPILTGPSAALSPLRSSSTTFRPATARRSTT
ncbi:MAG: hypothetical protein V8T17_02195 [Oscillospiraceae bacterium]